jgi:hypothetical protein
MRAFTVKAKRVWNRRRFDPALEGGAEGYSVSVEVGAEDRRVLDVLEAIQSHVQQRADAARLELDGRSFIVNSE